MIPNITRGSDPAGLLRYLFGRGRSNEHSDQHMVCASPAITDCFDLDGRPTASFRRIAHELDRWYRRMAQDGQPMPPDMRGRRNPGRKPGKDRIWHCSLAIKAGQGIMDDQQWRQLVERLPDQDGHTRRQRKRRQVGGRQTRAELERQRPRPHRRRPGHVLGLDQPLP